MKRRRWLIATAAALALALLVGRVLAGWYVDYEWFAALNAALLWRARAFDVLLLRGTLFIAGFAFVFLNLYAVRRSVRKYVLPRRVGNIEIGEEVPGKYLLAGVALFSLVLAALLAMPYGDWTSVDLVRHGALFGETDPYFQYDVALWMYWLPLESAAQAWAFMMLLSVTLLSLFIYALTGRLRWEEGKLHLSTYVRRHLFVAGAILLLLLSWNYRLGAYDLLLHGSGPLGAFSAIDHRVGMPSNLILSLVAAAAAMLVLWSGWTGQIRLAFFAITAVLLIAFAMRQIVPPVAERFIAPAEPELRERPYAAIHDGYTRRAFDVDRLTRHGTPHPAPPYAQAARGASLWDGVAIRRGIVRARLAATPLGALGWDVAGERLTAVAVEQPVATESAGVRTPWRVTRVAADVADERGDLVELAGVDRLGATALYAVLIHDSATGYVVVGDTAGVVGAPALRSLPVRMAYAWYLRNPRLLREDATPGVERVLMHRDVRTRLRMLYPFFQQGSQVSPVIWRDSLYWAVHLYSTSSWYPLSAALPFGRESVHFLRHAAVAMVNAHTARTQAIPDPAPDPLTMSWIRRFPSLFADRAAIDRDLATKIPPPVDAALMAALAFGQVGVRGEFVRPMHLPAFTGGDSLFSRLSTPPYFNGASGTLDMALPLLDAADRLRGIVTVGGGADVHMEWRPVDEEVSWSELVDALQQSGDSLRAALGDTRLLQGAVRVVPTASSVLALQTHYSTRVDGPPRVLYVSVWHRDTVATGLTTAGAVGLTVPLPESAPLTPEEFRARVQTLYDAMRDAMRRADWNALGQAYEALGRLLRSR